VSFGDKAKETRLDGDSKERDCTKVRGTDIREERKEEEPYRRGE
jgi:hypothetical protein